MPVVIGTGHSAVADVGIGATLAARQARAALGDAICDLVFVFVSGGHAAAVPDALAIVQEILDPDEIVGCVASGLVAGEREQESGTGIALWALSAGSGHVEVLELQPRTTPDGRVLTGLPSAEVAARTSAAILLADPQGLPLESTLQILERRLPGVPIVGGVASAATPSGTSLLRGGSAGPAAGLLVCLRGVEVLPCVSQGARPIGPELAVTEGEHGVIRALAGRPAIEALRESVESLEIDDRERIRHGLLLGLVVGPGRAEYGPGDFIVRGLAGADPDAGAVAVGAPVSVGQLARLHVRDPQSASVDLTEALALRRQAAGGSPIAGVLLFTCNGRGEAMFGRPHHDATAVRRELGPVPVAGFVAAGEVGPVGGRPFLHAFTATAAVFLA